MAGELMDIFEKGAAVEPSEGATKIPAKKQEGTYENLQSQKDKLEKQLAEKQAAWEKEKEELISRVGNSESQLQRFNEELEKIKNPPPKPIVLEPPQQPSVRFEDDPVEWF